MVKKHVKNYRRSNHFKSSALHPKRFRVLTHPEETTRMSATERLSYGLYVPAGSAGFREWGHNTIICNHPLGKIDHA